MKEVVTEREQRKARTSGADKEKKQEVGEKRQRCDGRYRKEIQENRQGEESTT